MTVKLLTEDNLEFLSLNGGSTGSSDLHLSKYHIVGNHMEGSMIIHIIAASFIHVPPLSSLVRTSQTVQGLQLC